MRFIGLLVIVALAMGAQAGEGIGAEGAAPDKPAKGKLQEIHDKLRNGIPLTPEEQELANRWKARKAGEKAAAGGPQLNMIDDARISHARIMCETGKPEDAVKDLEAIVKQSPDEAAKAEAHLMLGNIYRDFFTDPQKAVAEYKQVTGARRREAINAIISMYKGKGYSAETLETLLKLVDETENKRDKVLMLRAIADLCTSWGEKEKAAEVLAKIPTIITYAEAEEMKTLEKGDQKPGAGEGREKPDKVPHVKQPKGAKAAKHPQPVPVQ